jgi:P-aminobenzoate N-oxygenase AurF
VAMDLKWDQKVPRTVHPDREETNPYRGFAPYEALSANHKAEFNWKRHAAGLSDFLHGEQGALLVASQLVSCAPTYDAKLYAASQTFDEARHVEFFNRYLQTVVGYTYPISFGLKSLLDKILTDERWDLKFLGMQIIAEGLALAAFQTAMNNSQIPLFQQGIYRVIRDEARHVTFGVNYLEEFCKTLSEQEKTDRGMFAANALAGLFQSRTSSRGIISEMGWNKEEVKAHMQGNAAVSQAGKDFMEALMGRIIPNLKRIGVLTDEVRAVFAGMGFNEFEHFDSDGDINWDELSAPLDYQASDYQASIA